MLQLETFVAGAFVRLSFDIAALPAGTALSGKLQRNGATHLLTNQTNGTTLTMSSATNTLEAGKYEFVLLWHTTATNEPIEEEEYDLIIKARK